MTTGNALYRKPLIVMALICGVVCAGCSDSSKEIENLRSEISQLRAEVREVGRKIDRRTSIERPQMQNPEMRKKFDAEYKVRMEERRRMYEERRREMEERRKNRVAPTTAAPAAAATPKDAPAK